MLKGGRRRKSDSTSIDGAGSIEPAPLVSEERMSNVEDSLRLLNPTLQLLVYNY